MDTFLFKHGGSNVHHSSVLLVYCAALSKIVLYCSVLLSTIQNCLVPYSCVQCCSVLFSIVHCCTVLYSIVQHRVAQLFSALTILLSICPCSPVLLRIATALLITVQSSTVLLRIGNFLKESIAPQLFRLILIPQRFLASLPDLSNYVCVVHGRAVHSYRSLLRESGAHNTACTDAQENCSRMPAIACTYNS